MNHYTISFDDRGTGLQPKKELDTQSTEFRATIEIFAGEGNWYHIYPSTLAITTDKDISELAIMLSRLNTHRYIITPGNKLILKKDRSHFLLERMGFELTEY